MIKQSNTRILQLFILSAFLTIFLALLKTFPSTHSTLPQTRAETNYGDINGDYIINVFDLGFLADCLGGYVTTDVFTACDINEDGIVDIFDLGIFARNLVDEPIAMVTKRAEVTAKATNPIATSTPTPIIFPTLPFGEIAVTTPGAQYRVAIIGDSNSDEYRADDNRAGGTQYEATTLSWVELLASYRDIDFGPWSNNSRGEPRRSGYEYNWARSGATTTSMLSQGQHTGVVSQIANEHLNLIVISIGPNDFAPYNPIDGYDAIYFGLMTDTEIQAKIDAVVSRIGEAVDTIQNATTGTTMPMVVNNLFDWNLHPLTLQGHPDAARRQRVTDAIEQTNEQIRIMTQTKGVAYNDFNTAAHTVISGADASGTIYIDTEPINIFGFGDEPHNGFLSDYIHSGTILSGLMANTFIQTTNAFYNTTLPEFTHLELLKAAGIR